MWLAVAIISYFLNAGVYIADKFLLSKKIHSSVVYAFYVGIWSIFNFSLLVLSPWFPSLRELMLDLTAGMLFLGTLIFWYKTLHQSEATRATTLVGALTPIFSLVLSFIFLGNLPNERQFLAFVILIIGGIMISVKHTRFYLLREVADRIKSVLGDILGLIHAHYRPVRRLVFNSAASALLFAAYYILMKYIYLHQPFIGGFVWSRLGTFVGAILILFVPEWRTKIKNYAANQKTPKNLGFFLSIRLLAALAFIMLNWAISLGNVALINALQGTQFLFLLIMVVIISSYFPHILKEELGRGVMFQKVMGIVLVSLGIYVLITA
ncbi:hypothetical protein D6821_01010 [Candidatus Parcubacteria bacterium]|nr:MAG: hypothetical protein D6821_01010 [Candidatus Parcubacteria bacterium]